IIWIRIICVNSSGGVASRRGVRVTAAALAIATCAFQSPHSADRGASRNRRPRGTGDLLLLPGARRLASCRGIAVTAAALVTAAARFVAPHSGNCGGWHVTDALTPESDASFELSLWRAARRAARFSA